jgi:hypothetical protein
MRSKGDSWLVLEGNLVILEPVAVQLLVVASHLLHQQLHPFVVLVVVKQDVGKRPGLSQSVVARVTTRLCFARPRARVRAYRLSIWYLLEDSCRDAGW